MEKTKRVLAILMAVLMVATVFPMNVFAADANTPVSITGSTFKQGGTINAEVYSSGGSSAWIGLYEASVTPGPEASISWANASVVTDAINIANYETWKSFGTVNKGDYFNFQADNEYWYLVPGDYKLIYFADGEYTNYDASKIAQFTVTSEIDSNPEAPGGNALPSLSVEKTTFCEGEGIEVTATGSGTSWVGIYDRNDVPSNENSSYFWYYVTPNFGQTCVSGQTYVIQDQAVGKADAGAEVSLPAGNYSIYYFEDSSSFTPTIEKEITIKPHGEITDSGIDKASFKNEGAVKGVCKDCGIESVKEVIGKATMELETNSYEYTGEPIEAVVIVKDAEGNVIAPENYTVQYKQNVEVSTDTVYAVATVTFKSSCERYQGSHSLKYFISEKHTHEFTRDVITNASFSKEGKIEKACTQCPVIDSTKTVVIPAVESAYLEKTGYIHTGAALTPAVVLKDSTGAVLVSGTDYTVSYANNTDKGTATATVTLKKANYEGTKELEFTIGAIELDKSEYELGEAVKLTFTASGAEDEWIGIYYKSSAIGETSPSITWADTSSMTSGMDVANYEEWTVLESGEMHNGDAFSYKAEDGTWHLLPGEYKVVIFADEGYTAVQSVSFKVKEKELRKGVTVAVDKETYSESESIKVTVTNGAEGDSVAVYKKGASLPAKLVMLPADGKVEISAKNFENGTYNVVVLQENVLDFVVATSEAFTVKRTTALNKTLKTDKTEYCGAQQIKVTAVGSGKDWVGIYNTTDVPGRYETGAQQAYYWYYANGWSNDGKLFYGVGDEVVINAEANLDARENFEHGSFAPGSYKVILFENDEYTELARVDIQIVGHSFEELSRTESTCTVKGSADYRCTVCGYVEKQELPLAEHNWSEEGTLVSEATCEKDAVVNNTCLTCGANEDLTVAGSAKGHDYKLVETQEGTCLVPGFKKYSCSNAGCEQPVKTEEVIIEHEYVETVILEPTCTEKGLNKEVCKWCSSEKNSAGKEVAALGHNFVVDAAQSTPADCQKDGVNVLKCSRCSETKTEAGEGKKNHSYKDVYTKATTDKDGKIESKCEYCGVTIGEPAVISKVSEIYLDETKFTFDNTEKKPIVIVKDSKGKSLKVNSDFTIEYKNNIAVGTGTVVVKFIGDKYEGEKTLTFTIAAAGSNGGNTTPGGNTGNNGGSTTPGGNNGGTTTPGGNNGGTTTPDTHKHTEVTLPAKAATYKASGLTAGKKCSTCGKVLVAQKKVARKKLKKVSSLKVKKTSSTYVTLSWKKVTGADSYKVYYSTNGKKWKSVKVKKNTATVKKLKSGTQYRFKVRAFAGKYYGTASKILKKTTKVKKPTLSSVKSSKKKTATVSWKKVTNANGYVVEYSTSKKFTKKTTKKVTIKKGKTVKTTLKKLKSGKKYYVRVKAYKTVSKKAVYGGYSKVKTVKVK